MRTLFDRTSIGSMRLKNRIYMAPMGTTGEADGSYCSEGIDYFEERAKGGAGLIITGANVVSTKYEPRPCTELSDFHHVERLNMLIDRCHHYGAKVCVQLSPGLGRQQFTDPFTPPYSAGAVGAFWFPDLVCKPFEVEDIKYLVERIGYSASLAVNAGADSVMLHAYGGYLLDQFHSVQWNNRTDEYGGSLENRMRFTLECIEAMRRNISAGMPILVKFTPHQRVEGFRTIEEGIEMAKILEGAGVDALLVDTGCYEEWFQAITTIYSAPAHKKDVQRAIKEVVGVPILGDGKYDKPDVAKGPSRRAFSTTWVSPISCWPTRTGPRRCRGARTRTSVPASAATSACSRASRASTTYCAVNPQCYAEKAYALPAPDGTKRSVLVIGGGPGGMEAAITARQRGFDVELWERSDRLGGTLWPAGGPDFKSDIIRLIDAMALQCEKLGVVVRLGKEATPEALADVRVDKIVLATGSTPAVPPIPGIENAIPAVDYLTHKVEAGRNVVIIGGGLAGTESACDIAPKAESVTIVEMLPDILLASAECLNNDQHLRKMVAQRGVRVVAGARVTAVTADSLTYEKDGETVTLACDCVLNAAGFKASDQLEDACLAVCEEVAVVGDATAPRKILDTIHEGYHAVRVME